MDRPARRPREPAARISPRGQALAAEHAAEWASLTEDERPRRDAALREAIRADGQAGSARDRRVRVAFPPGTTFPHPTMPGWVVFPEMRFSAFQKVLRRRGWRVDISFPGTTDA